MGQFPTAADRKECEDELEDLCWLHNGVTARVCR